MGKVRTITVEKTDTGFSAYSNQYPIFTTGSTIPELIDHAYEAISLWCEELQMEFVPDNIPLRSISSNSLSITKC